MMDGLIDLEQAIFLLPRWEFEGNKTASAIK